MLGDSLFKGENKTIPRKDIHGDVYCAFRSFPPPPFIEIHIFPQRISLRRAGQRCIFKAFSSVFHVIFLRFLGLVQAYMQRAQADCPLIHLIMLTAHINNFVKISNLACGHVRVLFPSEPTDRVQVPYQPVLPL